MISAQETLAIFVQENKTKLNGSSDAGMVLSLELVRHGNLQ